MLTGDLVRVRFRKGVIQPPYIAPEDGNLLGLAKTLIGIFERHVGLARYDLDEELKDFLGAGADFLVHRGLSKLLRDRCEFEMATDIAPIELRQRVFSGAAAAYRSTEQVLFDRKTILDEVAQEMERTPETLDGALYADLKEAELLIEFKGCSPEWLLQRYNVALAQAILLRATGMDLVIEGETVNRYREVFRKMKFFQLLHGIYQDAPGKYHIHIDGPLSIFKSSQRYGLQMAQFLPTILHCTNWKIDASILWGIKRREATFRLTPAAGLQPIGHSTGQWMPEEVAWLEQQFNKVKTDWNISPDAEVVNLGGQGVLAPDYIFVHQPTGMKVYMEILGFWRRGGVQTRLDLLKKHGPPNLILAISKELAVEEEEAENLPGEIYVFRQTPIAREINKLLERMREKRPEKGPVTLDLFE
jgi:hypothetical protein